MSISKAVEKAYKFVRERTLEGVYSAGLRITEQEIADATGVSRTPVREALRRLQAEGFLTFIPNQGAAVTQWSGENIDDIFELRALLESYGAARAADRVTAKGIRELKGLAQKQYDESLRRASGYIRRIGEVNSRFHRTLQQFSGNARLVAMLPALIDAPLVLRTFEKYEHSDLVRSAAHHLEIVSALEARNAEWAAAVMRSHVCAAQVSFRQISRAQAGTMRAVG
ncbi:MAG: GntR family transcriptional regulator [Steroidobacteraceae bacterium]